MPAFIKSPSDEVRWAKAKKAANKSHSESEGDSYWAIVNHIYQKMTKVDFMQNLVEKLNKITGDEDEEAIQDYEQNPGETEDLESQGIHEFDPYEEGSDEADTWLREHDPEKKKESEGEGSKTKASEKATTEAIENKSKSKSGHAEWQARKDYTPEEQAAIKSHTENGYSPREAERMAGAHKGPSNFQDALTHPVKPSQMSEKMLTELKGMAGPWLERADRQSKLTADPEKNPMKYASGKLMQAHEDATKDYNKAYNDFLNSDTVKGSKGMDRHKVIQSWKQDWKKNHPEYNQNLQNVSSAQKHFKEAGDIYNKNLHDRLMHLISGGIGDPGSTMSSEEAAQHVGGVKGEEGKGHTANIIKDPSASFAESHKPFMEHAQVGQASQTRGPQTRLGAAQEQMRAQITKPKVDPTVAHKVIVRRANPEQMDRFKRASSARNTLGVGNKPKGEE